MNKLFSKIAALSVGLAMAIGVGVAVGSNGVKEARAADEVYYTLDGTSTGGSSGYDSESDITQGAISWKVTGNTTMNPWRIGGKSLSGVDRPIYSTTAMGSAITKMELTVGTASSITVNSLKLIVASDEDFSNIIDEISATFAASSTMTFVPTSSASSWATNSYYKILFNLTVSGSSNKFVQLNNAKFYRDASTPTKYTVTYNVNGGTGSVTDKNEYDKNAEVTVLGIGDVTKSGYTFVNWSNGEETYKAGDKFNIVSNTTLTANWYKNDIVTPKEDSFDIYNGGSLVLSSCVTADGDGELSFTVPSNDYYSYDADTLTVTADSSKTGGPATITAHKGLASCEFKINVVELPPIVSLPNIGSALESALNEEIATTDVADEYSAIEYTLNYYQCKKQAEGSSAAIFMAKNVSPFISNHTEMPGSIESVKVYTASGAAAATSYDVAFGTSEFTEATAGIGAYVIGKGSSHVYENESVSNATYFCITLGNANNGQVLKIEVTYQAVDPSLNNMTIYLGDAAAEGQSVDYKSSGSYQFVAKEDSTALTDVKWSVSDESVATINASTGALSCVKPDSVTVYAEKDGYNKASASITFAKGSVSSLAVSGEMSKKEYTTDDSWSHDGLVATATYSTGWAEDVSSSATWTYNPENPADGVESVVVSASFGGKSGSSSAQAVTVTVAHAGTAADPFTVAEGIAKCVEIGNKTGGEGPWVTTGVISKIVQVLTTGYQNARVYMTEDGKESSPSIYVYDFKYLENAGFTEETAAYIVVGATITVTGNLLYYNNNTPEYARGCYLLDIQQPETGDVDVTFAPASTSFEIGASGTFTASSETSGAVFTWAVDNPSVLSVNESTGAYEALSLGIARVTVTASAGGKEGYAFVDFAVCGAADTPLSVAEANALAANVESGKTTSYYVYVEGYVKEFATSEKDGKPRALDIMSEDGTSSIMVYTNVDPYADFVNGLELGDYLKVKANVQNYNGKYELVSPEKVSNHASAFTFAFELLEQTDGQCATYVDGTSDYNTFKTFFEGKWGALEDAYNALASIEGEQTKVLNALAKEDGNVLEQAMARYDFLVGKYKLDNFVTGRTPKVLLNSGLELNAAAGDNTSIIIIVIAAASALAFTTLLVFKKKRQK